MYGTSQGLALGPFIFILYIKVVHLHIKSRDFTPKRQIRKLSYNSDICDL